MADLIGIISVAGEAVPISAAGVSSIAGKTGDISLGSGLTMNDHELSSTCSTVSVSATGTSTDVVKYITIDGVEKKVGSDVPVTSVNSKVGDVVLSATDVGALPDTTPIPTKTSDLTNDSDFITSSAISDMATKTWTQDQGYLTSHQSLSAYRTSADQDTIDATFAKSADLATVATSGSYNDLTNKPTIPTIPVTDVQVNGTSILSSGVANIPLADTSSASAKPGVIVIGAGLEKISGSQGQGQAQILATTDARLDNRNNNSYANLALTLTKIDSAVRKSLCDGQATAYSTSEKTAACTRIGAQEKLTAGTNIQITDNTINSTVTYTLTGDVLDITF